MNLIFYSLFKKNRGLILQKHKTFLKCLKCGADFYKFTIKQFKLLIVKYLMFIIKKLRVKPAMTYLYEQNHLKLFHVKHLPPHVNHEYRNIRSRNSTNSCGLSNSAWFYFGQFFYRFCRKRG